MKLSLAPSEGLIMKCLWESRQDLTVYELTERLREQYGKEYANNTVATFLTILMKKGFVSRYKKHHPHQYHPEITMEDYMEAQLEDLKDEWYDGSAFGMMASLVRTSDISENELKKLKEMLDEYSD